jgi:cytidyltransferase-like protein
MFDNAIVHGRFQPFHRGHQALVESAFQIAHQVAVIIGNVDVQNEDNPWDYATRKTMITTIFPTVLVGGNTTLDEQSPLSAWGEHIAAAAKDVLGVFPQAVVVGPAYNTSRWNAIHPPPEIIQVPQRIEEISGSSIRKSSSMARIGLDRRVWELLQGYWQE